MELDLFDIKGILSKRDNQITLAMLCVGIVCAGGYYTYKWHNNKIQKRAQRDFVDSIDVYKQAFMSDAGQKDITKKETQMWNEVEVAFKTGYFQNSKSTLAPFFLAFESEALIKLGKFDEAYKALSEAIKKFSKNSPYYYLYSIKKSLLEIDKKDEKSGVEQLINLVSDKNNILKDMSAFYLGEYYWSKNDIVKAKEYYNIAQSFNGESTWAKLSTIRLKKNS